MHDTGTERYHVGNSLCDEGKTMFLYLSSAKTVTPMFKGLSVITQPTLDLKVRQTHLRVENITDSTFQKTAVEINSQQINQNF